MGEVPLLLWHLRTSSEIHAVGEREVRIFKGFRCRLNYLAPRRPLATPNARRIIVEAYVVKNKVAPPVVGIDALLVLMPPRRGTSQRRQT